MFLSIESMLLFCLKDLKHINFSSWVLLNKSITFLIEKSKIYSIQSYARNATYERLILLFVINKILIQSYLH
jgi:hypothetical protein